MLPVLRDCGVGMPKNQRNLISKFFFKHTFAR